MAKAPRAQYEETIDPHPPRLGYPRLREAMKAILRFSGLIVFGAGIGAERRQLLLRHWLETPTASFGRYHEERSVASPSKLTPLAKGPIPLDWIAQISLSFQVDESSALSPGVTLNTTLPNAVKVFGPQSSVSVSQSRSVGFGGTLSSTATRIDKFDPSYSVRYLMIPDGPNSACTSDPFVTQLNWIPDSSSPFILEGNLGIEDWLFGAILTDLFLHSADLPKGGTGGAQKPDTISYEVKFVIVSNGNVTPTWKLVNISANTSGTFFSTGRTRTHDLILTIGPNDTTTIYSHLASQIGQAVSGGNTSLLTPTH